MNENPGKTSSAPCTNFSIYALAKVNEKRPNSESPTLVTKAEFGIVKRERIYVLWVDRIAHKATSGMGIESHQEEESKVVGVPEHLKCLMTDLMMSSRIHQEHDEKHKVSCYASRLGVVNLLGKLSSQFLTRHEGLATGTELKRMNIRARSTVIKLT